MEPIAIGVDVGATKIATAAVSQDGQVLATRQRPTAVHDGPEAVIARIVAEIEALAAERAEPVCGVGIGVPGLVNPKDGIVLSAVNMGWSGIALRSGVATQLESKWPVHVENDVRSAARGEALLGAGRGINDFVLFTLGSGLGSAAMVNGQLIHGAHFVAPELGHLVLDVNGRRCNCGLNGCAETVLSGPGLIATTREFLALGLASTLVDSQHLTTHEVLQAARRGDAAANAALAKLGEWLGIVMATASAWLNPLRFIIGGGLGLAAFDLISQPALAEYQIRVLRASQEGVELVPSQVDSSAVGAAALAFAG